ncbi:MAG: iron-containing alcohol dehydrogenase, partial [Pseudomonadota bacterium]
CGVERALPAECAEVKATYLAALMKAPANIGMAKNSACDVADGDMDEMAELMLDLPVLAAP